MTTVAPVGAARRWGSAAVLSASLLVVTMDLTILNIALPDLAGDLRPSSEGLLWVVDAYSLVLAGLLVSMSALGDRIGRRRLLLAGYALFGLASAGALFASTTGEVIAVRALLGVGGAMIMPTTLSLIRAVFTDPRERATALGLWAAVSGIGAGVGPIVGGVLLESFSWRAAFLVNVPLMVVASVAAAAVLPESRVPSPGRWDAAGTVQTLVGMAALMWAVKRFAKEQSPAVPEAVVAVVVGVGLLAWFVVRCLRRPDPLLDVRLFARRPFTAGVVAALGSTFAMAAAFLLLAQWIQVVDGAGPVRTGLRLLPAAVAGTVASLLGTWLAARVGARIVLAGGLAVAGLGMVALVVTPSGPAAGHVTVALSLIGAGVGSLAVASAMIMSGTPDDRAGSAAAIEETAYDLGNVLGVAVLGSVAAILYTNGLRSALPDLDPAVASAAEGSVGAATALAVERGLPDLAAAAGAAFTDALRATGLIGGVVMLAIAVVVHAVTPKGTDITAPH
ncbi:quaternary ammonium compound efflux MFS transporter QacA [Saccharothrix violaceirubra]|uniref:DHA2 family multidrug resistance protein-like MFS transporter n=1 Tax=Saccharothrix violaceirubra TaxID=413306 RepID=A0A7W7T3L5_9PSEU|nr:MFS transporter [Saccharothrix violaceirubra]MBB4965933.1 DHA2 family multidrug resistance protein-like MFS transporter [Saccharothrix violaceirubra]